MSKFWTEDISQLFAFDEGIIPRSTFTAAENLNILSRIALILCIIVAALKPLLAFIMFCIILIVIISIYYSNNSVKAAESFTTVDDLFYRNVADDNDDEKEIADQDDDCSRPVNIFKQIPVTFDEDFVSHNQRLVGPANPKTLIPPIIPPSPYDLNSWKASDLTVHSAINADRSFDAYNSGYLTTTANNNIADNSNISSNMDTSLKYRKCTKCYSTPCTCMIQENAINKLFKTGGGDDSNLFINTIQPGLYQSSVTTEPISTLAGIGMSQHFDEPDHPHPFTFGNILPDGNDANKKPASSLLSVSEVYDPRSGGYGAPDRWYSDETSGENKYFYDDINSVRMPNYIVRNNVDTFVPEKTLSMGSMNYREEANEKFKSAQLRFRTDVQERFTRKRNAEQWQRRIAPITTQKI